MPPPENDHSGTHNGQGCFLLAPGALPGVLAKSAPHPGTHQPESLAEHSGATRDAVLGVAARIGLAGVLAGCPRFWEWAAWAALLHDTGKIAEGFQRQLRPGGQPWGERHEVLSLAYVDLLTAGLPDDFGAMIAAGVVFHHRCLDGGRGLSGMYPPDAEWESKFGQHPDPPPGRPKAQVSTAAHAALSAWLAGQLGVRSPQEDGSAASRLWERARDTYAAVERRWSGPVPDADGLIAVLLQGAVTLADHTASAHAVLDTATPVPFCYIKTVAAPYPHQRSAAAADGHLVLVAPTGSGKTEAGLAWASRQMDDMPGLPRLAWLLPYRASIDAIRDRFATEFGCELDGIGVLHATTAATLLGRVVCDDRSPGRADARKARAMAGAMRLFRQRVRVATPHQLLRAAVAGPKYASVLLEQANSMIVLDELHAYDPATFGRICAAMGLWERLGSRIAVLSATLAPPMIELITASLSQPAAVHRAPPGTAPMRHRLVLDDQPLTSPGGLDRVRTWLAGGRSVLVVANTVATAQQVFRGLASGNPGGEDDAAVLLHSRFKLRDRAIIEKRIRRRHPEREPGDPARRDGGLVVATQVLEVSLCLDFDRGVTEIAPVEAIAQRAGRVNRRGRHPDGPVEFRVHAVSSPLPYDDGAVEAARLALRAWDGELVSEQAVGDWLERAYATGWGREWAAAARRSRDEFSSGFLTFTEPFADRSEFAARLEESFDTVEVLLRCDLGEYRDLVSGPDGDPLLAAGLLIPIRWGQKGMLRAAGRAGFDRELELWVIDAPYSPVTGLDLSSVAPAPPEAETIL
jgi:CRISPR-associated endonuclease/helicase Cas3